VCILKCYRQCATGIELCGIRYIIYEISDAILREQFYPKKLKK